MTFAFLDQCLACGSRSLAPFLSLSSQPLANAFHNGSAELETYPLQLNVCTDCWHSQQSIAVDPAILYKDYPYASGTTWTLRQYFADFVRKAEDDQKRGKLRVLDIASNDGSLLAEFKARGHVVQGFEPASIAQAAIVRGIPTARGFWNEENLRLLPQDGGIKPYDVIVAMNVLGHVADPLAFLKLCKLVLAPGGRIYVQTSQATWLPEGAYDTLYHEHLSFFCGRSFVELAMRAGLRIEKIAHVPIHGVSYLVEMTADILLKADFSVGLVEKLQGYHDLRSYTAFAERVSVHADSVKTTIGQLRRAGYVVAGYGAAAKAMTVINYAGLKMGFIVDDAPLKQGKLCPGSNIPVIAEIPTVGKIAWLITAWNFKDEIVKRIKLARPDADDKFMTYFPTVTVE